MSEKKFFICNDPCQDGYSYKNGNLTLKKRHRRYKTHEKQFLFFKYTTTELDEAYPENPNYTEIPLFLYADGEDFFEFFTKRYFGKQKDSERKIDTVWEWTIDARIWKYSASEFLEEVKKTKKRLEEFGIDECDLVAQINEIFDDHGMCDKKELERRARFAEEAQKYREWDKQHKDELASKALEEMLK